MKKLIIYFLSVLVLLSTNGCNDEEFFTLANPPEDPWLNLRDFERAPVGAYWLAFRKGAWNNLIGGTRLLKTTQGDNVQLLPGTSANIPFNEMYGRMANIEIDKTRNAFVTTYHVIASCNAALVFIAKSDGNPFPSASAADIQNNLRRIEGELHFMRAYAYWMLTTIFLYPYETGGTAGSRQLPLRLSFADNFEGAKAPPMGSGPEIYAQILDDLTKAKSLLPERFNSSMHHPSYEFGRANRFTAAALLAKVYFMMDRDAEALQELNYVIDQNGGDYDLSEDPIEAFNKDNNTRGKEVLWYALYYDPVNRIGPDELSSMTLRRQVTTGANTFQRCTWNQFTISYNTLAKIGWMEDPLNGNYTLTEEAMQDKRFNQLYRKLEGYNPDPNADPFVYETIHSEVVTPMVWCDKYYRGQGIGILANIPVIRLAEMYLTRSLLRFRSGDIGGATSDLNVVRQRAGIGPLQGAISEEAIDSERIKELAFEGDRVDYLRSAKKPVPGGDRGVPVEPFSSSSFVWMLPQSELDLNLNYRD
jgi:hypothetical protein